MSHESKSDRKREKKKNEEEKIVTEAKKTYTELLENSSLTSDTQWRVFREQNKSNPIFKVLSLSDSMDIFLDFIKEVENKEVEQQKLKQLQLQKNSRKTRDSFRELLEEKQANREISKNTTWKSFKPQISTDPRYLAMLEEGVLGSKPDELFSDFVENLEEKFKEEKKKVKVCLKDLNFTDYNDFEEKITSHPLYDLPDVTNLKEIFEEIQEKVKRKLEKTERQNKRKALDILDESLKKQKSDK
jgi:hypothetical protein